MRWIRRWFSRCYVCRARSKYETTNSVVGKTVLSCAGCLIPLEIRDN